MRLWHYKLIPYLPKSQLLAQWRELNSMFKKQDNHILINYAYNDNTSLFNYSLCVIREMTKRGYENNTQNMEDYFWEHFYDYKDNKKMFVQHDNEYLTICYWNLREKYLRGQKDFTDNIWERLDSFYKKEIEK